MKLVLLHALQAPPDRIFAALTDPAVLQACIEGCERMTLSAPGTYELALKLGLAGLKGSYTGRVTLSDPDPPRSLTLQLEGKGTPGFVKGRARLQLDPHGPGTQVRAEGEASVGGLIAAVGSRLIEAAAKKLAADFFARIDARA